MELTQTDIERITRLVIERLGSSAGDEDIRTVAEEVIDKLLKLKLPDLPLAPSSEKPGKLIINAFGSNKAGLSDVIRTYANEKSLKVLAQSDIPIDSFRSIVIIVDCSAVADNINQVKFELDQLCRSHGFKAILQESGYYV